MDDDQLLRYSRHILLDEIGVGGQARLLGAQALLLGAGGLGSAAAMYLASAGVGRLTAVDDDRVDLTNLQRQLAHTSARVGWAKVDSLRETLAALNPGVQVQAVRRRADAGWLREAVREADVVLDCSDNYPTRQALNAACVAAGRPLVVGAALGFDGQVMVVDPRDAAAPWPCYACAFDPRSEVAELRCATMGVFAPLVGIIGAVQAAEALKLLLGLGPTLAGRLQMLDARAMAWTEIGLARRADCPVCGSGCALR